jgi:hypothetical protein
MIPLSVLLPESKTTRLETVQADSVGGFIAKQTVHGSHDWRFRHTNKYDKFDAGHDALINETKRALERPELPVQND